VHECTTETAITKNSRTKPTISFNSVGAHGDGTYILRSGIFFSTLRSAGKRKTDKRGTLHYCYCDCRSGTISARVRKRTTVDRTVSTPLLCVPIHTHHNGSFIPLATAARVRLYRGTHDDDDDDRDDDNNNNNNIIIITDRAGSQASSQCLAPVVQSPPPVAGERDPKLSTFPTK
jgi:hypothetical protein